MKLDSIGENKYKIEFTKITLAIDDNKKANIS